MKITKVFKFSIFLALLAISGFYFVSWSPLPLTIIPTNLLTYMAPLALTAGFIERAVEICISPLRDAGAETIQNELAALKAVAAPDTVAISEKQKKIVEYREVTQQWAFSISFLLGLSAAFVGIRALAVFLPTPLPVSTTQVQLSWFSLFDTVLTAALLAGGADGLHAPINAATSFFSQSKQP
jgi:hypothetical protein